MLGDLGPHAIEDVRKHLLVARHRAVHGCVGDRLAAGHAVDLVDAGRVGVLLLANVEVAVAESADQTSDLLALFVLDGLAAEFPAARQKAIDALLEVGSIGVLIVALGVENLPGLHGSE